jgi:hypothetical protein
MKNHLTSIIIVSLICIASGFGASLFFTQVSKLESQIISLQQEVHGLEAEAARLSAPNLPVSASTDVDELSGYFVSTDGALSFVEYVESLAAASGLTYRINLFDSEQDTDLAKHDKEFLKTSLTTTGSLKNTRNFISLIESLPYNIKITRVDLKGGNANVSTGVREANWTMMIDFSAVKIMEKN